MDTQFYIVLTLKTCKGPESFAKFFIGNNRDQAYAIFREAEGYGQSKREKYPVY